MSSAGLARSSAGSNLFASVKGSSDSLVGLAQGEGISQESIQQVRPVRAHVRPDRSLWQALTEGGGDSKGQASPGRQRIFLGFRVGRRAFVSYEKPTGVYK
jgi:hypothetical protein